MSQVPHVIRGLRSGLRLGQGRLEDSAVGRAERSLRRLLDGHHRRELRRDGYGITREHADRYALRSQQRAHAAWTSGVMAEEVVAVEVKGRKGVTTIDRDDHLRPETTLEGLAALPTVFKKDGVVTAGNASGIVDGAAALVLASGEAARARGLKPLARIVSWAAVGVEPTLMGMGPAPAIRKALERAGLSLGQLDLVEINEAFAPQYLACEKELGLDPERANVNGGAIALGHPLGASGARLLLTLALELRRRRKTYGVASACIGGGQGIAMIESIR